MTGHTDAVHPDPSLVRCPIMPTYGPPSVQFLRGVGPYLWDSNGKKYLDFLSGLAVTSLGHAHPNVAEAICTQANRLLHVSNLFATEHNAAVATILDELIAGDQAPLGQVFFCNSGAEANEGALKLARRYHHDRKAPRQEILSFERQWWKFAGAKEQAIRDRFDMSSTRYYQVLNALIDRPEALQSDPLLVRRLRRLRAARQRQRSARRLGFEL